MHAADAEGGPKRSRYQQELLIARVWIAMGGSNTDISSVGRWNCLPALRPKA